MNISASYYSAIGGRENNEDAVTLLESSESVIGVVADGLGGHFSLLPLLSAPAFL